MTEISHQTFDQERALYGSNQLHVTHCTFAGPADGESAFKESQHLRVEDCSFELRYPFWHDTEAEIARCRFAVTCRAPFWYSRQITLRDCDLQGVKAFRECSNISFDHCTVESPEFGWNCHHVTLRNTSLTGEYFLLNATDIDAEHLDFSGKYSFQYCKNVTIRNLSAGVRCHGLNFDAARYCAHPIFKDEDHPDGVGFLKNVVLENITLWKTIPRRTDFAVFETKGELTIKNLVRDRAKDQDPERPTLKFKSIPKARITVNGESYVSAGEMKFFNGDRFDIEIK